MADFTVPYRAFPPVDATEGVRQGMNMLLGVEHIKDRKERTNIMQQEMDRRNRSADILEAEIPFKWLKQKSSIVGDIAGQISKLPEPEMVAKYKDLVEKVVPMPLVKDSPLGPLGAGDPTKFLTPDEFAKLDSKGKKDYIGTLYKTSEDFTQFELEDLKNENKTTQLQTEYQNKIDQIKKESAERMKQIGAMGSGDIALERLRQKGDIALEREKQKGRGTDEKDRTGIIPTPDGDFKVKDLIDVYAKQYDIPKSISDAALMNQTARADMERRIAQAGGMPFENWLERVKTDGLPPWDKQPTGAASNSWKNYLNTPSHRQDNTR